MSMRVWMMALGLIVAMAAIGCGEGDSVSDAAMAAHEEEAAAAMTNRVAIPPAVRANLGVTFVQVERRRIEQTLRAPGRFEYLPTARREYRTMLPGRVTLLVEQFDEVDSGEALYRIDSPAWRSHQQEISEAEAAIERLTTRLSSFEPLRAAHREHERRLEETIEIRRERVMQLERVSEAGGGRIRELTEARDRVATAEAELAEVLEKEAQLEADESEARSDLAAARARRVFLLDTAASLLGRTTESLEGAWREIDALTIRAEASGVVESLTLTNGAWATEKSTVLTVVRPDGLRFRASGLQSDLGALRPGLTARIVPPTPTAAGRAIPLTETMSGALTLGLAGDANDRTIDLYVVPESLASWARPGVAAQLEIVTDSTAREEMAIPLAAVQRDGLTPVIFRRDPEAPNEAIRLEADLGADDGRWVAIRSGVRPGDEVVLDGSFQLMLAMSGTIQKGGHFHSDGTYHAEDH